MLVAAFLGMLYLFREDLSKEGRRTNSEFNRLTMVFFVFVSFPYLMAYKHSITVVRGILPLSGKNSGPMLLCCWICHVGSMAFSFVHDASWN